MQSKYTQPRSVRFDTRTVAGTGRGGQLLPAMATAFRESESGVVNQRVAVKLDSPAGMLLTPVTMQAISVYVPAQAIHAMKNDTTAYAGSDEVVRQELLSGNALFDLEAEGTVSKRLGVVPRSVSGTKYVNEAARLAHNCAVNYLRQRKYVNAVQLSKTDDYVTPALIGQTVLDRLNGVLDPEDRVNGAVQFDGRVSIRSRFMGAQSQYTYDAEGTATGSQSTSAPVIQEGTHGGLSGQYYEFPDIWGAFENGNAISLSDFYQAQKMDEAVRTMRQMVDNNPEHGEELVARFAHGLSVEVGKVPFVMYDQNVIANMSIKGAMDGANLDTYQTNIDAVVEFTVPVPATEFGGVMVTFVAVKPDETLASQPHPILSDAWAARNYLVDELAVDPVAVKIRDLNADCAAVDENTIALYVGNNHLLKNYVNYGFNRDIDMTKVANKSSIWQLEVPMSVTPQSVLYPTNLSHYPFPDQTADVVQYNVSSRARINTPIIFGPAPVEELAAIETENVFQDA